MAILPKGTDVPTIVEGAEEGATFQVEVSAHLMSLLAGLYSKREDSIVREVLCNAYDAQKTIGVDAPVVIEAPTELSPVLKIRDKGPGMSKDTVFRVYASYGTSTKGGSNEFTGGMGVGAKAVFCYTDTFTVISCFEGMESTYVAYSDGETGIPRIDLMASVPCAPGKTGVEVQVPVHMKDIATFTRAVAWNAQFHPVAPVIIGSDSVDVVFEKMPLALDLSSYGAPGWTAYPSWEAGMGVVMGSVYYPLTQETPSLGMTIMYQAPMGAVRFAPSREALKYDEVTVNNLKNANRALKEAYRDWVMGLIAGAETRFPTLMGSQTRALSKLISAPHNLGRVLPEPVLKEQFGEVVSNRFYPRLFVISSLPWSILGSLYFFDNGGSRREASLDKPRLSVKLNETEVWVCDCVGGENRLRTAMDLGKVKRNVFYTREESIAVSLAAHFGFTADTFIRYTSSLPAVEKGKRERLKLSGKVGGTFNVYPKATLSGRASAMDGDKALELTQGVYVEAALGGHDWKTVSTSGRLTLTTTGALETVAVASPWCPEPVETAVLRLNAADREKLKKKGYTLIPLADLVEEALDEEAVSRAHRDWRILCEDSWHQTYANSIKATLLAWPHIPEPLQQLILERLNEAEEGVGDLLGEAVSRVGLWKAPKGMTTQKYVELKTKIAALPFGARGGQDLRSGLAKALDGLDISRLGISATSPKVHKAGALAMLGALDIPFTTLSAKMAPPRVTPVKRAKATARVLPGQMSLFEGDSAENDDSSEAAMSVMRAAA